MLGYLYGKRFGLKIARAIDIKFRHQGITQKKAYSIYIATLHIATLAQFGPILCHFSTCLSGHRPSVDGRIGLKWIFKGAWTGLIWLGWWALVNVVMNLWVL
jgi:hypothetical protein